MKAFHQPVGLQSPPAETELRRDLGRIHQASDLGVTVPLSLQGDSRHSRQMTVPVAALVLTNSRQKQPQ